MTTKNHQQFFTTNYAYILQGMRAPEFRCVLVEPFAGNGDLLKFVSKRFIESTELYDIDSNYSGVKLRDTLRNPPAYGGKFVITNPPYLARNKSADKDIFDLYGQNDLYKCFLVSLIRDPPVSGIIIIPLNFWSSARKSDINLRLSFLAIFSVRRVNVFEERVFEDTSYTVCAVEFEKSGGDKPILFVFYPSEKERVFTLVGGLIGGEIHSLPKIKTFAIGRFEDNPMNGAPVSSIRLFAIDINATNRIRLEIFDEPITDNARKSRTRAFATLTVDPLPARAVQERLVAEFNHFLEEQRLKYHSMFLTNFRDSSARKGGFARKRIPFDLAYRIVGFLLCK